MMGASKWLNRCECGGIAVWDISYGGGTTYFGIKCTACGKNNRTHNSTIYAHGLGNEGGFPLHDRDEAIAEWNKAKPMPTHSKEGRG